ncbi:D-arabinitol 2-dehydrogenase [Ilyonectria robusta]
MEPTADDQNRTEKILDENPALKQKWTSLIPQGKMGLPKDLMGPVTFLLSDASLSSAPRRKSGELASSTRFVNHRRSSSFLPLVLHPRVEASPQLSVEARRHGSGDWFPRKARVPLGRHDHARAATDGPDDAALQVRCLQEQAFASSLKEAVWMCPPMVNETRRSAEFPTVPFVWLSVTRLVHSGLTPAKGADQKTLEQGQVS